MVMKGEDRKARNLFPSDIELMEEYHAHLIKQNIVYSHVQSYEDEAEGIDLIFKANDTKGTYRSGDWTGISHEIFFKTLEKLSPET